MVDDPKAPVRAAILGGGFMARVHSRAIRANGAELVSIASSSPARSLDIAVELGGIRAARSAEEIFADPGIEVVHICTPNDTHSSLAVAALQAGKHVVCEKPLGLDHAAAVEMVHAAAAAGRVAAVPFVYRFHPMVREARSLVRAGEVGTVTNVQGSYLQDWLLDAADDNWRVDTASGGASRAFGDIGSHLVDLLEFVTGATIAAVCAVMSTVHAERGGRGVDTEDLAAVLIRLSNGSVGSLLISQVAAGHANDLRFEIFGAEGSIGFAQEQPSTLTVGRRGRIDVRGRDAAILSEDAARLCVVPAGHPMGYQDAFNAFVLDTYATIRGTQRPGLPTFADGARANQLTDAVLRSAASGAWVGTEASAVLTAV